MSLGGFIGGEDARTVAGGPYAIVSTAAMAKPPLVNSFNFSPLSLALKKPKMDWQLEMALMGENFEPDFLGRMRDDGHDSRSGSDELEGIIAYDQEAAGGRDQRKKKYHRHTPYQIQELENYFKLNNHPDEKQRRELGRRLSLESKQVKFWFQNRRTQMKTQTERHENSYLKRQNEELLIENIRLKEALRNPACNNCGGSALLGALTVEENNLRVENARLREELARFSLLVNKYAGRSVLPMAPPLNYNLDLAIGRNSFSHFNPLDTTFPLGLDPKDTILNSMPMKPTVTTTPAIGTAPTAPPEIQCDRSVFLDLAMRSVDELIKLAQIDDPLWVRSLDGEREILNLDEYERMGPCIGLQSRGFVNEATRATGMVFTSSSALVEIFMDSNQWKETFPCMIGGASVSDLYTKVPAGSRNGTLQMMRAEFQAVTPLVPIRRMKFLRFCKQHSEDLWVVVDVGFNVSQEDSDVQPSVTCRRQPSGCVIQDMPNGYSKVTWIEHSEYDESVVHYLYRPLLRSGLIFGAKKWLVTLQRHFESLAVLFSPSVSAEDDTGISPLGKRSMVKLAQRITSDFCSGVSSTVQDWKPVQIPNLGENTRLMVRGSMDHEASGLVLSATTSIWMPMSRQRLFDFLRDEHVRSEWDELLHGGPLQEMVHIAKGQDHGNYVSLLHSIDGETNENAMLILQEAHNDESSSIIAYAPVEVPKMEAVMRGKDSSNVAIFPSGFAIVPDAISKSGGPGNGGKSILVKEADGGSLLTVGFQILISNSPTGKITMESADTVKNLLSRTIQRIKTSLQCD